MGESIFLSLEKRLLMQVISLSSGNTPFATGNDRHVFLTCEKAEKSQAPTPEEISDIKMYDIFFGRHNEDGGSIRCSTHPLVRKLS